MNSPSPTRARRCAARYLFLTLAALSVAAADAGGGAANAQPDHGTDSAVSRTRSLFESSNRFWSQQLTKGGSYSPAQLSFFNHDVRDVCGEAGPLSGPFYCPADMTVYLDRDFLDRIGQRLSGDAADYALAYLVGHELGLHIQDLVGTTDLVQQARSNSAPALSARTWMTAELQADCYSGLWMRWALAHHEVKTVTDVASILSAVSAVSSDWQAHLATHETMVDPLLTYGTVAQQLAWFERGRDSGQFNDCDTFKAEAAGKL
jgi:predicted metalloprotease